MRAKILISVIDDDEDSRVSITSFMTGYGDIPMSVKAMKLGAVDFLLKPFRDQGTAGYGQVPSWPHEGEAWRAIGGRPGQNGRARRFETGLVYHWAQLT